VSVLRIFQGWLFQQAPASPALVIRMPHHPLLPLLTGVGFWGSPCVPSSISGIRTPKLPLLPLWEKGVAYRGRFFGKPLRAIFRFRHQDAQTPPSPLVGEGGRGDEGQRCAGMQNIAHLSQKLYT
jgi:hypothetical protein